MFYKRRDLTKMKNGRNPIIAHEFVGDDIEGKDVIITDDILDSGDSILEVIEELKKRKVNKIFVAVSFGLFTKGLDKFNEYYEKGMFTNILSTNLTYRSPELLAAPWYVEVDASKYIAYLIDALNHDESISSLLNPTKKIHDLIDKYKNDLARRTADLT
jgi:ribose-phosphate pyrophosphokinase